MSWIPVVLSLVVGALFVVTGGVKVVGLRQSLKIRDHFGMAPSAWRAIGSLEAAGGLGVLLGIEITVVGLLALGGLTLLMLGAIASRIKVGDSAVLVFVDLAVLALVVTTAVLHLTW